MIKHKPKCLLVDRALVVGWKASRPSPDHIPTYISETVTEEEQQAVGVFSHVLPCEGAQPAKQPVAVCAEFVENRHKHPQRGLCSAGGCFSKSKGHSLEIQYLS